ncbi:MAG: hypothetical protein ABEJ02_00240 [Candidatus Paceibacteria bacterium]
MTKEMLNLTIVAIALFVPAFAFAGGGNDVKCDSYERKAQRKLCKQNKRQRTAAERLRFVESKTELNKDRLDEQSKKDESLSERIGELNRKLRGKADASEVKKRFKEISQEIDKKLKKKADKESVNKKLEKIQEDLEQLEEKYDRKTKTLERQNKDQHEALVKIAGSLESIRKRLEQNAETAKQAKSLAQKNEKVNKRQDSESLRTYGGLSIFSFSGGPGFTGGLAKVALRKPYHESNLSLEGEFGLGGGVTAARGRPAFKGEFGTSIEVTPELEIPVHLGYAQAENLGEGFTEFRYYLVSAGLRWAPTDRFALVGSGNFGLVSSPGRTDAGRGGQVGFRVKF